MAQRTIEEVFRNIAPRRKVMPGPGVLTTGVTGGAGGGTSDLAGSFSQAGREIAQLRVSYQQQADLVAANTQALSGNTSAHAGESAASMVGHVASSVFGGAFSFLSPVISGLSHLFGGGGSSAPAALPLYTPPPPISISGVLREKGVPSGGVDAGTQSESTGGPTVSNYSPQITVHVNAMDSQSFMDRSGDIANAVREAMLNNHPINGVVADL
jgi:hypothetical protein